MAIRNRPGAKPNGRNKQRSVEQASKDESVFEGDPLVVESAVRKVAQELFVGCNLSIQLIHLSETRS